MAFIRNQNVNEGTQDPLEYNPILSSAAGTIDTPSSTGTTSQAPQSSGSFTNLQRYLSANAGGAQGLGNRVAGVVEGAGTDARNAMETGTNQFKTAVDQGTTQYDSGLLNSAANNARSFLGNVDLTKQLAGGYSGPQNFGDVQGGQDAYSALTKAQDKAQFSGNVGGRTSLIRDIVNQPGGTQTSSGGLNLNQFLVQNSPVYNKVADAANTIKPLGGEFLDRATNLQGDVNTARGVGQATRQQALGRLNQGVTDIGSAIGSQLTAQQTALNAENRDADLKAYLSSISGGNATARSAADPADGEWSTGFLGPEYYGNRGGGSQGGNATARSAADPADGEWSTGFLGPEYYGNRGGGSQGGNATARSAADPADGEWSTGFLGPEYYGNRGGGSQGGNATARSAADPAMLARMGLTQDQFNSLTGSINSNAAAGGAGINLSDYLTGSTARTLGTADVATEAQKGNLAALAQLTGNNPLALQGGYGGYGAQLNSSSAQAALQQMTANANANKASEEQKQILQKQLEAIQAQNPGNTYDGNLGGGEQGGDGPSGADGGYSDGTNYGNDSSSAVGTTNTGVTMGQANSIGNMIAGTLGGLAAMGINAAFGAQEGPSADAVEGPSRARNQMDAQAIENEANFQMGGGGAATGGPDGPDGLNQGQGFDVNDDGGYSNPGSTAATAASPDGPDGLNQGQGFGGGGGGGDKIICTAMNDMYGLPYRENKVWLKYSSTHLTTSHQKGYHKVFLPLVNYGFKAGDGWTNKVVRNSLIWIGKNRTSDIQNEVAGKKRNVLHKTLRAIAEPTLALIGKMIADKTNK